MKRFLKKNFQMMNGSKTKNLAYAPNGRGIKTNEGTFHFYQNGVFYVNPF